MTRLSARTGVQHLPGLGGDGSAGVGEVAPEVNLPAFRLEGEPN
jgi:hypothetical protein